jgi:hypothetical protein
MTLDFGFVTAIKEKSFARGIIRRLLRAHEAIRATEPLLTGDALYREVLRRAELVEPNRVDELMRLAEDSVDEWTAPGRHGLRLRELAHYVVLERYRELGHAGSVVSFGEIVNSMIAPDL